MCFPLSYSVYSQAKTARSIRRVSVLIMRIRFRAFQVFADQAVVSSDSSQVSGSPQTRFPGNLLRVIGIQSVYAGF